MPRYLKYLGRDEGDAKIDILEQESQPKQAKGREKPDRVYLSKPVLLDEQDRGGGRKLREESGQEKAGRKHSAGKGW